ncbi:tRNA 2-thiocytidine(32) synthetase TtcA [Clostridiaceae bacterium OttesenSCG-928-D20]|nr:tRNA 2-thiocytidine(32) synthetase TtcA [Clostridiaceae bacterium OttesenSCG-928-D20]
MKKLNELTGYIRRAVDDYNMISEGDRIAVGISGGKDSLALLLTLSHLKRYYPKNFYLEGITLDLGFEGMDYSPIEELCRRIGVSYTVIKTDIREVVFDVRKEKNPCSLCAKMRRGGLNDAMKERGMNKLALGHHYNDAVETYLMSLFYEGRMSCFKPVTWMSRAEVTQIRPLIYCREEQLEALSRHMDLPIVKNPCPQDRGSKRYEIKKLIEELSKSYPDLESKIFGAMQRLPLDGWELL